jgi:Uma2 family endonuclease
MGATAEKQLNVDEFLAWADGREGNWELHDGAPVAMSPERVRHTATKSDAFFALRVAVDRAGAPCRAYSDGITVRVRENRAFVPDALVCPAPPPDAREISNPVIVVEVVSPSTAAYDHGEKLAGYFALPSVAHYLILDPDRRLVIHHARAREGVIETRMPREGRLCLDPPGLELAVAELFASAD